MKRVYRLVEKPGEGRGVDLAELMHLDGDLLPRPLAVGDVDARLLKLFDDPSIRRTLSGRQKLDLPDLAQRVSAELGAGRRTAPVDALSVHRRLVRGLPGVALFVAAALAFDSLTEATNMDREPGRTVNAI